MSHASQPAAGPSKPRRKPVTENWDEDFDFDLADATGASAAKPGSTSKVHQPKASVGSLSEWQDGGNVDRARVVSSGSSKQGRGVGNAAAKDKVKRQDDEVEDWDADFADEPSRPVVSEHPVQAESARDGGQTRVASGSTSRQGQGSGLANRRDSRGPAPLKLRPVTPPRTSHVPAAQTAHIQSTEIGAGPYRPGPSTWTSVPPPSVPSYQQPSRDLSVMRPTNDSTSSLGSAWSVSASTPNNAFTPTQAQGSLASPSSKPKRTLKHMKSGDMMPPPPLPNLGAMEGSPGRVVAGVGLESPTASGVGSALQRRRSEKRKSIGKSVSVEEEQVASPGAEKSSKPGFWRRLSSQQPTETAQEAEARRNRSSSVGSPTKQRFIDTPPLPPLPPNLRSASNASTASHHSTYSQHSGSSSVSVAKSYTSTGLASILRRSSSNLAKKVKGRGGSGEVPPTPSMQSARITSGSSAMSSHSLHSVQSRVSRSSSQQSFSRGYHLPSPAPQSPYGPGETLHIASRPNMHQSVSYSATPIDYHRDEPAGPTADDTQTTPKKRRPVSVIPSRTSGWKGDSWTGLPPRSPQKARSPRTGVFSRSPVKARPALGVSSSSARFDPRTPTTPRAPITAGSTVAEDEKGTSTFKRLQSLGKKHGRRLSGGWKFGTTSSTSSEERDKGGEKRAMSKLETVKGSPSKSLRGDGIEGDEQEEGGAGNRASDRFITTPAGQTRSGEQAGGGVITYSSPALKLTASPRLLSDKFDQHVEHLHGTGTSRLHVKEDKERRRQSWNDFVIPRNVLEKQKELKEGIRGVRKFASGVEALRTLQSTHAAIEARIYSADDTTKSTFNALEDEFDQWWEMATVLIEVGNTGQGMSGSAASVSPVPPSPPSSKRNRRITLASEEAKAASSMMRRAQTDFQPLAPVFNPHSPRIPGIPERPDVRKASLPDPAEVTYGISGSGGPPRASPDLWHGSTGRHELSKRQLEVLRTMLQTPVSGAASVAAESRIARPGVARGMSGSSTVSSAVSGMSGVRASSSMASQSSTSRVLPLSASTAVRRLSGRYKGPESFPSPGESTYITPSDSMPSPMTASLLAQPPYGQQSEWTTDQRRQASKMRKGSKVGLAGLREFLKGLKGKESRSDLTAGPGTPTSVLTGPDSKRPAQQVGRRASRISISRAKGLMMSSPPGTPTPGSQWAKPVAVAATRIPANVAPSVDTTLSRTTTSESDYGQGVSRTEAISKSASRNEVGPPVAGKDRRRPGLRGIFRGGSGNWGDMVNNAKSPMSPDETTSLSAQLEKTQISGIKRTSISGTRHGVHPNPRQSSDPVRRQSRIVSDATSHRSTPVELAPNVQTTATAPSEHGMLTADHIDLGEEGDKTVRPRKSRVLGLGWPEEVPRQAPERAISTASGFSFLSEPEPDQQRHSSAPAAGTRVMSDTNRDRSGHPGAEESPRVSADSDLAVQDTGMVALTPENLPVLLEYLRQCEGKLGEWRKRVEALDLGPRE